MVAEPPGGRHGGNVGGGVGVGCAYYDNWSAPVEDCGGDGVVSFG